MLPGHFPPARQRQRRNARRRTSCCSVVTFVAAAALMVLAWRMMSEESASMGLEGAGRGLTNPSRGWEVFDELLGLTAHEAGLEVDVVSVSLKPTCVTQRSVAALNKHLRPRNINIITGSEEQCRLFSRHGKNVRCWREDRVVPGLTKDAVAAAIDGRFGEGLGDGEFNGRQLAGWYFQQLLKLGSAAHLDDLTEYFVIWDPDMVPLHPVKLFQQKTPGDPLKTLVNIGGANAPGYFSSYSKMFGRRMSTAPDGSSFVTHWVVVHKPLMLELLDALTRSNDGRGDDGLGVLPAAPAWARRILSSVRREHLMQGFSEYATYVSWVHQHHPSTQVIAPRRNWLRHPVGGRTAVWAMRWAHRGGLCCPTSLHLWLTGFLGYRYTGFEIGHTSGCHYTDIGQTLQYGLD